MTSYSLFGDLPHTLTPKAVKKILNATISQPIYWTTFTFLNGFFWYRAFKCPGRRITAVHCIMNVGDANLDNLTRCWCPRVCRIHSCCWQLSLVSNVGQKCFSFEFCQEVKIQTFFYLPSKSDFKHLILLDMGCANPSIVWGRGDRFHPHFLRRGIIGVFQCHSLKKCFNVWIFIERTNFVVYCIKTRLETPEIGGTDSKGD